MGFYHNVPLPSWSDVSIQGLLYLLSLIQEELRTGKETNIQRDLWAVVLEGNLNELWLRIRVKHRRVKPLGSVTTELISVKIISGFVEFHL
jgi:hypothetical protein